MIFLDARGTLFQRCESVAIEHEIAQLKMLQQVAPDAEVEHLIEQAERKLRTLDEREGDA
jgi:hypothetical protein